jgi:hypothetical protein
MFGAVKALSDFALALIVVLLMLTLPKYRRLDEIRAAYELGRRMARRK